MCSLAFTVASQSPLEARFGALWHRCLALLVLLAAIVGLMLQSILNVICGPQIRGEVSSACATFAARR